MNDPRVANAARALRLTLLRGTDLVVSPWKNGGGVTREIAAEPAPGATHGEAFAWRVSIADVEQAGPFSNFDGIDRTLVLLDGDGMLLDESGERVITHTLRAPGDVARFNGAAPVQARLIGGPTQDFNLMVRRGIARGELDVWRHSRTSDLVADTILLYDADGSWEVSVDGDNAVTLGKGDALRIDTLDATDPLSARGARNPIRIGTHGAGFVLLVTLNVQSGDAPPANQMTGTNHDRTL